MHDEGGWAIRINAAIHEKRGMDQRVEGHGARRDQSYKHDCIVYQYHLKCDKMKASARTYVSL